jgi:hypothetical protein
MIFEVSICEYGGIGRRPRLKILCPLDVPVRVRLLVPNFRLVTLTLIPMIASIEGTGSVAVARDLVKDPGLGSIPLQFESVLA